jgi:hypothetical protein
MISNWPWAARLAAPNRLGGLPHRPSLAPQFVAPGTMNIFSRLLGRAQNNRPQPPSDDSDSEESEV